jgi:pimeloyl-ACP methyl ester carboxylesterase
MLVNGHDLHIERYGPENGLAVVLLHHGLGSVHAWKEQIPLLVQSGWQVIAYDRWGYGGSEARPALDLPTFACDINDLEAILEIYELHQVALVGHSDGGTIALYFAAQHPELVCCVVALAAHIYVEPKMEPGIMAIKQAFAHDERFRLGLRHAHGDKFESTFDNWFDGWHCMEALSWDMRPVLRKIRCPVLVVQGEQDEHATPQHAKDISSAIPGAELWLVQGAGHMLPQEHAGEFNTRLLQFLGKRRFG